MKRFLLLFAAVSNLAFVDQLTKEAARHLLGPLAPDPRPVEVIPGFFRLAYVENRGCAWGLFQGQVWPLAVFGLFALAFLVWKRRAIFGDGRLGAVAEPLLYAGIVGNAVDRFFRGFVIDMLDFHWGDAWHFPCFNLADTLICTSVGLLILASLSAPRDSK